MGLGGSAGRGLATALTWVSLRVNLWIGKTGLHMRNVGFGLARLATFSRSILLIPVNQTPINATQTLQDGRTLFSVSRLTWLTSPNQ